MPVTQEPFDLEDHRDLATLDPGSFPLATSFMIELPADATVKCGHGLWFSDPELGLGISFPWWDVDLRQFLAEGDDDVTLDTWFQVPLEHYLAAWQEVLARFRAER